MIRFLKALLFVVISLIFLVIVAFVRITFWMLQQETEPILAVTTNIWAKIMLQILGITVSVDKTQNAVVPAGTLITANHQSYLDIIVIASSVPTLFVAKKNVRSWPLLGWMAALGGTLFIDREKFRGAVKAVTQIEQTLRHGVNVQIFPEGTSSDGSVILPFRSFLFTSAISVSSPVQPVTINYTKIDEMAVGGTNRDIVCWYGSMTFIAHFWQLLSIRSVTVSVVFHPVIPAHSSLTPKMMSDLAYAAVGTGFRIIS
ncbi:MAG: lysophospholipid acyltransferase family protein [Bacteriovoracaceae bacterium]|nr:1-acyl-sn-glycerol-3-phosphate acyltransferase [Bacteroidota bacterium]